MKHQVNTKKLGTCLLALCLAAVLVSPAGAAMVGKTIEVFTGVTIYVDGVEMKPTDANGKPVDTFVYNGTTYVPLRAVSQSLGYNVQWDGSTQSVYIGDDPRMTNYLLSVCPPYETNGYAAYENGKSFNMSGEKYTNGFSLGTSFEDSYAIINLNGKYSSLSLTMGHVDGSGDADKTVSFIVDGTVVASYDVNYQDLAQQITVPLNGGLQLKIVRSDGSTKTGFANAILH